MAAWEKNITVKVSIFTQTLKVHLVEEAFKDIDGCNIISKSACRAHTGKNLGSVVRLYIHKALSRQRVRVDTDIRAPVCKTPSRDIPIRRFPRYQTPFCLNSFPIPSLLLQIPMLFLSGLLDQSAHSDEIGELAYLCRRKYLLQSRWLD